MTVFILVVLGIIGLILVFAGLSWLVVVIRRHPHLLRISGTVLSVEEKYEKGDDRVTFFPVIAYTTPEGNQVRFRSAIGTTRTILKLAGPTLPPWRVGQSLDVYHDPSGDLAPCIASLWSLYSWPAAFLVGGILLLMIVANKWNQIGGH